MPPKHLNFILLSGLLSLVCYSTYRLVRPALVVGDAVQLIERFYVETVDTEKLVNGAMDGLTGKLDENSTFIAASQLQSFNNSINQEFAGVGILIEQPDANEPVRVITPMIGSPALEAGFMPGDRILRVAGVDVTGIELAQVSEHLKGPIDTNVDVTVRRGGDGEDDQGEEIDLVVRRQTIQLESVIGYQRLPDNTWSYRLPDDPRIAYVRLTTFGDKTPVELQQVLRMLNNDFDSLILDVRGNGGGLLTTAVAVCDMFLNDGRVVSTKIRDKVLEQVWDAEPGTMVDVDKPMVVLIDGNSASASEIVAACFQDYGRAVVAGVRSYGKGTVQNILPLQSGRSALRLTVATYYRPNDQNIHRTPQALEDDEWGVTPNEGLVVELDDATTIELYQRCRMASYPMLGEMSESTDGDGNEAGKDEAGNEDAGNEEAANSESGGDDIGSTESVETDGEDTADVAPADPPITGDPQLDRAIWHLRGGTKPAVTPADSAVAA